MYKKQLYALLGFLILVSLVCGQSAPATAPTEAAPIEASAMPPTADVQATVDIQVEATVSTMVTATMAAAEAQVAELEEEPLADEIDSAANQVADSTEQAAAAAEQAAADGTITAEETEQIVYYVADAEAAIAYTEYLIETYYGDYAGLAEETLELLVAIEDDLAATTAALDELLALAEQGAETASDVMQQIEDAAQQASQLAQQIGQQSGDWRAQVQENLQQRADQALAVQPNQIPGNLQETLQSVRAYVDAVREALDDNILSSVELGNIAQLGANASAGLQAHGGPNLQGAAGQINQLTGQIARGQFGQARQGLGDLERQLPSLPRP
jgi:hypothetical protein